MEKETPSTPPLQQSLEVVLSSAQSMVTGEFQLVSNELRLLQQMDLRAASEYGCLADVASGLSVFVDKLHDKNESLRELLSELDRIEEEVGGVEAAMAVIDRLTREMEQGLVGIVRERRGK